MYHHALHRIAFPLAVLLAAISVESHEPTLDTSSEAEAEMGRTDDKTSTYPPWETRRYLQDERDFLKKFRELAERIEVFPFQWVAFPGAQVLDFADNRYVDHEDTQSFYHFADLARTASKQDLDSCVNYLDKATAKERVLLLVILHFALDDDYLPAIAQRVTDYSVPFPRLSLQEHQDWRVARFFRCRDERIALGLEVKTKSARLDYLERRVLRDIGRFHPLWLQDAPDLSVFGCTKMQAVSDYALAILELRGCRLVESMQQMSELRRSNQMRGYGDDFEGTSFDALTVESVFSEKAWKEYRRLELGVRRLRHECILSIYCLSPADQDVARRKFCGKLDKGPPLLAALLQMSLSQGTRHLVDLRVSPCGKHDDDFAPLEAACRRIPKEQIVELLTANDPGEIDADLDLSQQSLRSLGYVPYFKPFVRYLRGMRSHWFTERELVELEPQLNAMGSEILRSR